MKPIYGCLLMLVMIFPMALFAKSDSTTVNFTKPIVVAGKQLPAGKYDVHWKGNGPAVQVTFKKNDKVVATAPAKLVNEKNPYNAFEANTQSGRQVLMAIDRSNLTLKFGPNANSQASSQ